MVSIRAVCILGPHEVGAPLASPAYSGLPYISCIQRLRHAQKAPHNPTRFYLIARLVE